MTTGNTQSTEVCAIIVAYSDISLVEKCIRHLEEQSAAVQSIILVDNSPGNAISKSLQMHPKIKVVSQSENTGSAGGFSIGMKLAYDDGADWIWLHDEDDYPDADCLEKMLLESVGSLIRVPRIIDPVTKETLTYFKRNKGFWGYFPPASPAAKIIGLAGTAGMLIHRDVIHRIGVYDPAYFVGYEDYDFCLRAGRAGLAVEVINNALVYHPDHQSAGISRVPEFESILCYFPAFWGIIRKNSPRDHLTVRNFIILNKRYRHNIILLLQLLISLIALPVIKTFHKDLEFTKTLKTYIHTLFMCQ